MPTYSPQAGGNGETTLHFYDYWRVISLRWPLILLVFLLVVITAGVVTYLMPRQYLSKVTMEVPEDETTINVFSNIGGQRFDPRFLTTQFEIIQRKEVLYPVIESLDLQKKWGITSKETALRRLRSLIDVREIRNTQLIEIMVYDTDPQLAADIANRIAEEYQRKREEEQNKIIRSSLKGLEDEVAKHKDKVDKLRAQMNRLRLKYEIQDLNPDDAASTGVTPESSVLLKVEEQVSTEKLNVSSLRAKYYQIKNMTDDQILRSIATLEIQDQTILQVLPEYQGAIAEEARLLSSGLGINHPTAKAMRAKKESLQKQLMDQIAVLRGTLETKLRIAEESLKGLEQQLEEARKNLQDTKTRATSYYEAKNEWLLAKKVSEEAETKLNAERMQRALPLKPPTIWERAEPAQFPARPRVVLNMALAVIVGLAFGIGLAFFIEYLDTSVKTMEDIEKFLQLPVLAVIPKNISILLHDTDDNPDAEAYRIMRTNIEFNRKNTDANTITVVSGGPGEGKSTTLVNLAYTFAKGGYSTLVVDADLRRPSMHRHFGVANTKGLSDYLTSDTELDDLVQVSKVENLYFMPSGRIPHDLVGVLNSSRMVELIEEVKGRFDMVFFDSPPILGVSDASILASCLDFTLIVVQHRRFPRSVLERVKQAIQNVGGNIIGVVLNNVDVRHDQYYEYYTSYYNYYHAAARNSRSKTSGQESQVKPSRPAKVNTQSDDNY